MWEKIKNILACIGGAFVAAMLFCLGRRSIYGSAGDSHESALGQLREGAERAEAECGNAASAVDRSQERIEAGAERIADSEKLAGEIAAGAERAKDHAGAIREILKAGKKIEPVGES